MKSEHSFTEGRSNCPREVIGPMGSNCFSSGVRTCTSISKEIYNLMLFQGGGPDAIPPSGSAHIRVRLP